MALRELVDTSVPAGVSLPPHNGKIPLSNGTSSSGHQSRLIFLQAGPRPDLKIPIRPLIESFMLRSAEAEQFRR